MNKPVTAVDEATFFKRICSYLSDEHCYLVQQGVELARQAHGESRRKSGELFFIHPLTIAYYLAEYQLDASALVAALLHDVAEDTLVSMDEIKDKFGHEVARLVDAVTKFKDVPTGNGWTLTPEELPDATLHKLLAIMTDDVRAVIIKLFDRLHNLRTISAVHRSTQMRTAQETLFIYAPLANRLGMWNLMNELGHLSLEVYDKEAYTEINNRLQEIRRKNEKAYKNGHAQIKDRLQSVNIHVHDVVYARENVYTIYRSLKQMGKGVNDIDNRLRLVVLVDDWPSCYTALGALHQLWKPVPDTFTDYIAVPRDNLYQSLHTTVIDSSGQHIRVHIRTKTMEELSAIGILARWRYAGTPLWTTLIAQRITTFMENISGNIHLEPNDPRVGVQGVLQDVLRKQIHVYTPKGEAVELGSGATALDFAYAIHTGLGNQCDSAHVNGVLYPLNRPLKEGDQVHIVKRMSTHPSRAWLDEDLGYLATTYAQSHVRRWFRRLSTAVAIAEGQTLLQAELDMLGLSDYSHEQITSYMGLEKTDELYHNLGRAELLPTVVATRIVEEHWAKGSIRPLDSVVLAPNGQQYVITNADGRCLNLCGTCNPHPGDKIVGYLRLNGQVTVHQESCHSLARNRLPRRTLKIDWGTTTLRKAQIWRVEIDVYDRPGLLYEITQLMEHEHINIPFIHTPPTNIPGEVHMVIDMETTSPRQLVRILHQVQMLDNVFKVHCIPSSSPPQDSEELLPPSFYRPE